MTVPLGSPHLGALILTLYRVSPLILNEHTKVQPWRYAGANGIRESKKKQELGWTDSEIVRGSSPFLFFEWRKLADLKFGHYI